MKYRSKRELLENVTTEHDALWDLLGAIPEHQYAEPGVWGDRWTIHDLVAHLSEWQRMFLRWYRDGERGLDPQMPAPGFKWNETPRLNHAIWEKHRKRSFAAVEAEFASTYGEILQLLRGLPEASILEPGRFQWTGKNPLATYVGPNTASHYRFAQKVLKRWLRARDRTGPDGSTA